MLRVKSWRSILQQIPLHHSSNNAVARTISSSNVAAADEQRDTAKFKFYKSRGQHILANPRVLDAIIRKSGALSTDTVLEIGPGTGNLTVKLLESAGRVIAIEIDPRMIDSLLNRVANHKFADKLQVFLSISRFLDLSMSGVADHSQVISGDALEIEFPEFDLCVANIPYGISSPLILKLLIDGGGDRRCFRSATILLQKEFAKRMVAKPGNSERNRLAVNVSFLANVNLLMDVSKRDFVPPPKVDSSLVEILPRTDVPEVDFEEWRSLGRICFCQKRKTLGAIFKQKGIVEDLMRKNSPGEDFGLEFFRAKIVGVLREGGFMEVRATALSEGDLLRLLSLFNREGIRFRLSR